MGESNKGRIKTPAGYLLVETKGAYDEYPGVWVSLSADGEEEGELITCIEYDTLREVIQTCTYKPMCDDVQSITLYEA